MTGSAVVGGELFLTGCQPDSRSDVGFSPGDIALLDEVGETIIPETTTPGARAIHIGEFMRLIVTDCYTENQQSTFMEGLAEMESSCKKIYGNSFMQCSPTQKHDFLITLEKEAKRHDGMRRIINKSVQLFEKINQERNPSESEGLPAHYYTMMKQLTLLGFFTSESGMTETLRHEPVPGRYDGAMPYAKGEKAWAE